MNNEEFDRKMHLFVSMTLLLLSALVFAVGRLTQYFLFDVVGFCIACLMAYYLALYLCHKEAVKDDAVQ
jgi:hypothetical protein